LVLGGVTIEGHAGLAGHSDADVVSHALIDALLGAAALGDLGRHFPGDERFKDASSIEMLSETVRLLADAGWAPNNVDITIVAEAPRLGPHGTSMVTTLARAMQIDIEDVSVKSTTTDGLGFVGRNEGIAALAVATVRPLT
jgi:2-C-methyl-D-erythritol 2,4-cyclodiphosphate synthase